MKQLKKPTITKKVAWWVWLLVGLSGFGVWWGSGHDDFLYSQAIGEVVAVKNGPTQTTVDDYQNHDQATNQTVVVKLTNTKNKAKKYVLTNTYTKSRAMDHQMQVGQKYFLNISGQNVSVSHYKRDQVLLMLAWLVVVLLLGVMQFAGLRALGSVLINFVLFMIVIRLDVAWNLTNFFWLFALAALVFTAISLALILGVGLQFWLTFSSIIAGVVGGLLLGVLAMAITNDTGMHYEALDFATQSPKQLFLCETLIGLLGTVMDAATDISATLLELKATNENVSAKQLWQSGRQVGQAIMGPLINVLLLIFFCETITMATLYLKTGNTYGYTFEWTMALGLAQVVISGIGIALVIPATSLIAAFLLPKIKEVKLS